MGPCYYCKKMIYLDWIAERGYHRACHEKAQAEGATAAQREDRAEREHEKRRERKRLKRIAEKQSSKLVTILDRADFQNRHWDKLGNGARIKALDAMATVISSSQSSGWVKFRNDSGVECSCYIEQVQEIHSQNQILVQRGAGQ